MEKKTDISINYKLHDKLKLPNDGYVVKRPAEFDEDMRNNNYFTVYSCIIKKYDSINIYSESAIMIPKEDADASPNWKVNIGKQMERSINSIPQGRGYKYINQYKDKVPVNKKVIVHRDITADEYARNYLRINARCCYCETPVTVNGNDKFQKLLFQIPGSKNMAYACSVKCKTNFKDHMKAINGSTSKEVRKRYHKAMYSDVYGYVYGIYDKKSNMWYVGKVGRSPFARWEEHMMKNKILSQIPIENLRFEILETVKATGIGSADIETLWNAECKWISHYDSYNNGYNIQMPTKYLKRETIGMEDISNEDLYNKIVGVDKNE